MYGSPARMRLEQETARRGNASAVITTVVSLLVVAAAVAAVAWLVLRSPSAAVDSAERLDPVGTALPAPTEQPTLPTPIPTEPSEPAAPGFTGEAPEVSGLPTAVAPREAESVPPDAGPTPTPRVVALPTAAPPTLPPTLPAAQPTPLPAPTLPPAVPVEAVPVVALDPVEVAQPAPTAVAEPAQDEPEGERRTEAEEGDDDPFNIFGDGDGNGSRIVPAQNDALERARALQDDDGNDDEERGGVAPAAVPVIEPAEVATITERRDGSMEIVVPDVDAMIDEITARVTDPNRNPNVGDAGRDEDPDQARDEDSRNRDDGDEQDESDRSSARNRDDGGRGSSPARNRARSVRERINDRIGRDSDSRSDRDDGMPSIVPGGSRDDEDPSDDCFPFC